MTERIRKAVNKTVDYLSRGISTRAVVETSFYPGAPIGTTYQCMKNICKEM